MKKLLSVLIISAILCVSLAGVIPAYAADHSHPHIFDFVEAMLIDERLLIDDSVEAICNDHGIELIYAIIGEEDGEPDDFSETLFRILTEEEGYSTDMLVLTYSEFTNEGAWYYDGRAYNIFSEDDMNASWDAYFGEATYENATRASARFIDSVLDAMGTQPIPDERLKARLVDDADLLTDAQETALLAKLDEISSRQECDVAIITVGSLEGKGSEDFAHDYFDYNGYGYGDAADGILFLISMEDRDWAISTHGFGIPAFTDAGQARIIDQVKPSLSSGDYNEAFTDFADLCDKYLEQARTGEPYDVGNMPRYTMQQPMYNIVFSLIVGAVVSWMVMKRLASPLKTVKTETRADKYERDGSMKITGSRENFTYANVSKTLKQPPPSSSSGGRSGGSSTRSSSSGRSHGGSSGKF